MEVRHLVRSMLWERSSGSDSAVFSVGRTASVGLGFSERDIA